MSLLLSEGHSDARSYPVAVVWSEARVVRERLANRVIGESVMLQTVIASLFSKEGQKALQALTQRIEDVG